MKLTQHEQNLIQFVRGLPFEALLDAETGIEKSKEEALAMSRKLASKDERNSAAFLFRANELKHLTYLLGLANEDYCNHIYHDDDNAVQLKSQEIKELAGTITSEGQVITFKQHLEDMGGTGQLYGDYVEKILAALVTKDISWLDADDYMAPIACQIITEAAEVDQELYNVLALAIQYAYCRLKQRHSDERAAESNELGKDE